MRHKDHARPFIIYVFFAFIILLALWVQPARAQFKYTALNTEIADIDIDIAEYELQVLSRYIAEYPRMLPNEQKAWQAKVHRPYPAGTAPVEAAHVDWLLHALDSETFSQRDAYWPFAYQAFVALRSLIPNAPELPPIAKRILAMQLPSKVAYMPHETLVELCLTVLANPKSDAYMDVVLSAEHPDFWRGKTENATLVEPSSYLDGEEDPLLLTLRAKSVLVMARYRPLEALDWLDKIMARTDERPGYLRLMQVRFDLAARQLRDEPALRGQSEPDFTIMMPRLTAGPGLSRFPTYEFRPVLRAKHLLPIKPSIAYLREQELISEETERLCEIIADKKTYEKAERIACCRTLAREKGLPVELERWVTMHHVLLAGHFYLADELERVAFGWLERYPDDWDPLPAYWKKIKKNEVNVNFYLRSYLAQIYSGMDSIRHTWPMEEREKKFRSLIKPVFDARLDDNEEMLLARLYFLVLQDMLHYAWATELRPEQDTVEAQSAWDTKVNAVRDALETELLGHLDTMSETLEETKVRPVIVDKRRGIVLPYPDLVDTVKMHANGLQARQAQRRAETAALDE